jgi:mRNA interferase RelE/StbE
LRHDVKWHEKAVKDLKKLDRAKALALVEKVKTRLAVDPVVQGTPLKGLFKGLYRYRVGDYRVIYAIDESENTILILKIGDRKSVYRQHR